MAWSKPITTRTTGDVEFARTTPRVVQENLKGFLNISDIKRIRGNCNELARYFNVSLQSTPRSSLFTQSLFMNIFQNILTLTQACDSSFSTDFTQQLFTLSQTMENKGLDFVMMNALEQILLDMYRLTLYQDEFRPYTGSELYTGELGE